MKQWSRREVHVQFEFQGLWGSGRKVLAPLSSSAVQMKRKPSAAKRLLPMTSQCLSKRPPRHTFSFPPRAIQMIYLIYRWRKWFMAAKTHQIKKKKDRQTNESVSHFGEIWWKIIMFLFGDDNWCGLLICSYSIALMFLTMEHPVLYFKLNRHVLKDLLITI